MDEEYYNWIHDYAWTETDAKDEGCHAYREGLSGSDNPFDKDEEWGLHLAWEEGYNSAVWDD